MKLPYKLYSYKPFWVVKYAIQRLVFELRKRVFSSKELANQQSDKADFVAHQFKSTLRSILFATFATIALFFLESQMAIIWHRYFRFFPELFQNIADLLPRPNYQKDRDAIIELISVIASLTGVILALFYPVLASIISTAYSKVHESIRDIIIREKGTQNFLKRLTFVTAFSILILIALSLGYYPKLLILSILVLLALINLFYLVIIGMGVYRLFDPSSLSSIVVRDLSDSIKRATINGLYWSDRSFQINNYNQSYASTENLTLVIQLSIQEYIREASYKSIIERSLFILRYYLYNKPQIPIDSMWFPRVHQHRSYFESDMSTRDLSKSTNTFIHPESRINQFWLEERIVDAVSISLESILKDGHRNVFGLILNMTHGTFDLLGSQLDTKTAKMFLDRLMNCVEGLGKKRDPEQNLQVLNYDDWRLELICVESYAYALVRFQIEAIVRLTEFNSGKIEREYNKINWKKKASVYSIDTVYELYTLLDRFRVQIENERLIEGKVLTPDWYFKQHLTSKYLTLLNDKLTQIVGLFETNLLTVCHRLRDDKNHLLSAYVAQIGLEGVHKMRYRILHLRETISDINKLEVCKGEFTWTIPNFERLENDIARVEGALVMNLSKGLKHLSVVKWNNRYPDVFAQSYSILSTHINTSLVSNDCEKFKQYFPAFLHASLNAVSNLNKTYGHLRDPRSISHQTLIDAMQISGYAYIYSVMHNDHSYWEVIMETWNSSLKQDKETLELIINCFNHYKQESGGVGVNYNEKHARKLSLSDTVKTLRLKPSDIDDLLVKPFMRSSLLSIDDTTELFIELYVFSSIESKELTGRMERRIFERLCRDIDKPENTRYYDDDIYR